MILTEAERKENEERAMYEKPLISDEQFLIRRLAARHKKLLDEGYPTTPISITYDELPTARLLTAPFPSDSNLLGREMRLFGRAVIMHSIDDSIALA